MSKILTRKFFNRPTIAVARRLLGKFIVRRYRGKNTALMITEVEAYDGPRDLASHASRGRTPRTKIMFGDAGYFYVYFTYGMHWMLNVVTGPENYPAAILIRGGKIKMKHGDQNPSLNSTMMHHSAVGTQWKEINGPARLTKFLKIDGRFNGLPANKKTGLWFEDRGVKIKKSQILANKRIGVDYAGAWAKKPYNLKLKSNA